MSGFLMIFGNAGVAVMFLMALQSQQGRVVVLRARLKTPRPISPPNNPENVAKAANSKFLR